MICDPSAETLGAGPRRIPCASLSQVLVAGGLHERMMPGSDTPPLGCAGQEASRMASDDHTLVFTCIYAHALRMHKSRGVIAMNSKIHVFCALKRIRDCFSELQETQVLDKEHQFGWAKVYDYSSFTYHFPVYVPL